jgi:hypothetical protein
MTYRDLWNKIELMTTEQLDLPVTVHLSDIDEFFPVDHLELTDAAQDEDRLEDGHPILVVFND